MLLLVYLSPDKLEGFMHRTMKWTGGTLVLVPAPSLQIAHLSPKVSKIGTTVLDCFSFPPRSIRLLPQVLWGLSRINVILG